MRRERTRCGRPNIFRRILAAFFRHDHPRFEDRRGWGDPPPDIGVREPRRPYPRGSSGATLLEPPAELN